MDNMGAQKEKKAPKPHGRPYKRQYKKPGRRVKDPCHHPHICSWKTVINDRPPSFSLSTMADHLLLFLMKDMGVGDDSGEASAVLSGP